MDKQFENERLVIVETLSPRELEVCQRYTEIGGETFSQKRESVIAAGYSENSARAMGTKLWKKSDFRQQIRNCNAANMIRNNITVDSVLASIEHDKLAARKAGQFGIAKDCAVAQGKWLTMFSDRMVIDEPEARRKLSEKETQECKAIAKIRLLTRDLDGSDLDKAVDEFLSWRAAKSRQLDEKGKEEALQIAKARQELGDAEVETV